MSGPGSSARPRRLERGEISWVSLLLLVVVVGGGYLASVWVPVYFQLFTVKQVVRDYMNQAVKNGDDEGLRRNMVLKIRSLEQVEGVDADGRPTRTPAIALDEQQVTWERDRDARPPTLRVAFEYERPVVYPLIGRTDVRVFAVDLMGDLTAADWGPAR